jgi:hypothetical protein
LGLDNRLAASSGLFSAFHDQDRECISLFFEPSQILFSGRYRIVVKLHDPFLFLFVVQAERAADVDAPDPELFHKPSFFGIPKKLQRLAETLGLGLFQKLLFMKRFGAPCTFQPSVSDWRRSDRRFIVGP